MMNLRYTLRARKYRARQDPAEIDWVMNNVQAGASVFDIGAHKGGWTYWLRKAVTETGNVFAFEPQPTLNTYLKKLFVSCYWQNVTLEDIALSNNNNQAQLFIPGKNGSTSPGASLKHNVVDHESDMHTAKVNAMLLDNYIENAAISNVDFIKVDVEGSELDLLEGATQTLKNHNASWIIESEARHIGEAGVQKLFSIMNEAGYSGKFFIDKCLTPISEFSFHKHQNQDSERFWDHPSYYNNFLFTRS